MWTPSVNDVERLKKEKGGLEVWEDLPRIATEGYAGISADDILRLRWLGLYETNAFRTLVADHEALPCGLRIPL